MRLSPKASGRMSTMPVSSQGGEEEDEAGEKEGSQTGQGEEAVLRRRARVDEWLTMREPKK